MPLQGGGTPQAFSNNIKTEMNAGKPQKQAIAIAYSEKAKTTGQPDAMKRRMSKSQLS